MSELPLDKTLLDAIQDCASVCRECPDKGVEVTGKMVTIQQALVRARKALELRNRTICFMASTLLEQAETGMPVVAGDESFKVLKALAGKHKQAPAAPVEYFYGIADTLAEIAKEKVSQEEKRDG